MKIKELFWHPKHWCRKNNAVTEQGKSTAVYDAAARAWDLIGAAQRCYPNGIEYHSVVEKMARKINKDVPNDYLSYVATCNIFNDNASFEVIESFVSDLDI